MDVLKALKKKKKKLKLNMSRESGRVTKSLGSLIPTDKIMTALQMYRGCLLCMEIVEFCSRSRNQNNN